MDVVANPKKRRHKRSAGAGDICSRDSLPAAPRARCGRELEKLFLICSMIRDSHPGHGSVISSGRANPFRFLKRIHRFFAEIIVSQGFLAGKKTARNPCSALIGH